MRAVRRLLRALEDCLNESPSEKEGKSQVNSAASTCANRLNESPSEKEGKFKAPIVYSGGRKPQ